jgi:membrane protease YdiL (CAAX protease family)
MLTLLYLRTEGSLPVSILMHASISSSALIFGQKFADPAEELRWTAVSVGVALLAAAVLWVALRPRAPLARVAQGKPRSTC